jgi:hypothetical protein
VKPQSKQTRSFGKTHTTGLSRPLIPGKCKAISPLRLRWFSDWHDLQDNSPSLSNHSPIPRQDFRLRHTSATQFGIWIANLCVMRHLSKLAKTTIRLTESDRKILQRLTDLTGLKQSQLIRAALRALLRRVERPIEE